MKGFIAFLAFSACIILAAVFCAHAAEGTAQSSLVYSLKSTGASNAGHPVIISFTLENLSDETHWVLKWLTPLEGIQGRIFKVKCSGQDIPYEGPLVSRIGPFKSDYVRIGPRASVSSQVDLSAVYRLPIENECTVSFTGRIMDVRQDETLNLDKGAVPVSMEIPGNSVTLQPPSQN